MKRSISTLAAVLVLCGALPSALAEETLDSVEKKLIQQWGKHKSMSAKTAMSMQQGPQKMEATGLAEFMRTGEKELSRIEMNATMTMGEGESAMKMNINSLIINDGEFAYSLQDQMGNKMAVKLKPEKAQPVGGQRLFASLREAHDLRLLPPDKVDGKPVYVLEAIPKEADPSMPGKNKMQISFDQATAVPLRYVIFDDKGAALSTMSFSDVKIDPQIDASRFVFTAPEGVEVIDQTNL